MVEFSEVVEVRVTGLVVGVQVVGTLEVLVALEVVEVDGLAVTELLTADDVLVSVHVQAVLPHVLQLFH